MDFLPDFTFATEFSQIRREALSLEEEENMFRNIILQGALWHKSPEETTAQQRPLGFKDRDGD
jgi:hypothetical protein